MREFVYVTDPYRAFNNVRPVTLVSLVRDSIIKVYLKVKVLKVKMATADQPRFQLLDNQELQDLIDSADSKNVFDCFTRCLISI